MKQLKILVVLLFVLVTGGNVAMELYQRSLDTTPPEISVPEGTLEVSTSAEEADYLEGVTARDDRDGDLTGQVVVEHISQFIGGHEAKITYAVFDQAGNAATATRRLRYTDYTEPRFSLSWPLRYQVGATVTLLDRLTAVDDLDGDISNKIRISSQNLTNDMEGTYTITVQVTNDLGDTAMLTLPVIIETITADTPEITLKDYLIYLEVGEEFDPLDYLESVEDPAAEASPRKSNVEISNPIETDRVEQPGTYYVSYTYEGEQADCHTVLTVVVLDPAEGDAS